MQLVRVADGTVGFLVDVGKFAEPSDKVLWDRMVARTYSNDALCPMCEKTGNQNSVQKTGTFVLGLENQSVEATMVRCYGCYTWVLRVPVGRENKYFTLGLTGLVC